MDRDFEEFKAVYRCTHPSNHRSADQVVQTSHKHTDCQAIMRVTIKSSTENQRVRSNDVLHGDYPTLIAVEHNHNHRIEPADALETKCISQVEKTNDSPVKRPWPKNEDVREDCVHSYEVEKTNDSPAVRLLPKDEDVKEDCVHSYELEKTNDSPAKRLRPKNKEVREDCRNSYEVEKTNDSPAIRVEVKNEEVRKCYEEPVDSTVYPSLYVLSNTDALREIELTAQHVEVTTEPFVKIEKEPTELNWSSLKHRWKLLFENWQKENSVAQYDALVRAVTVLNNCKTETAAISVLECLGKHLSTKPNGITVTRCVQSDNIAKFSLSDHNYNKQKDSQNEQFFYTVQDCGVQQLFLEQ